MSDVLSALAWLVGALVVAGLLVWASLRGAIKAARLRRDAEAEADRHDDPPDVGGPPA